MSTKWRDLLALPFARADCWALACMFNARRGVTLPDLSSERPTAEDSDIGLAALDEVQGPAQVGDLLLSDPEDLGYASHVAVVVEPGWALTTSRKHGPQCLPLHRTPSDLGVWRARAEPVFSGAADGDAQATGGAIPGSPTHGLSGSRFDSSVSATQG